MRDVGALFIAPAVTAIGDWIRPHSHSEKLLIDSPSVTPGISRFAVCSLLPVDDRASTVSDLQRPDGYYEITLDLSALRSGLRARRRAFCQHSLNVQHSI